MLIANVGSLFAVKIMFVLTGSSTIKKVRDLLFM